MTANAMQGDRQRCLDAGMDDYISKPIRLEALVQALKETAYRGTCSVIIERAITETLSLTAAIATSETSETQASNATPTIALPSEPAIDETVIAEMAQFFAGNFADLGGILTCYLEDAPTYLQAIQQGLISQNAAMVHCAAHTLKSSSASLGAMRVAALCDQLEDLGRSGDVALAAPLGDQLELAYAAAAAFLNQTIAALKLPV